MRISDRVTHISVLAVVTAFLAILGVGGALFMYTSILMLAEFAVLPGAATFTLGLVASALAGLGSFAMLTGRGIR